MFFFELVNCTVHISKI